MKTPSSVWVLLLSQKDMFATCPIGQSKSCGRAQRLRGRGSPKGMDVGWKGVKNWGRECRQMPHTPRKHALHPCPSMGTHSAPTPICCLDYWDTFLPHFLYPFPSHWLPATHPSGLMALPLSSPLALPACSPCPLSPTRSPLRSGSRSCSQVTTHGRPPLSIGWNPGCPWRNRKFRDSSLPKPGKLWSGG